MLTACFNDNSYLMAQEVDDDVFLMSQNLMSQPSLFYFKSDELSYESQGEISHVEELIYAFSDKISGWGTLWFSPSRYQTVPKVESLYCLDLDASSYLWRLESTLGLLRARGSTWFRRGRIESLCLAAELSRISPTSTSKSGSILAFLQQREAVHYTVSSPLTRRKV